MKIDQIQIQGFRAFNWVQTLDLSKCKPGLYQVTGQNLLEPELGANGVGKSSLFEGFDWILTGKTSRGLRAGDVRNWLEQAPCVGILEGHSVHGSLSIMRAWQPNTLEVSINGEDPRPVDQSQLEQLIGIPPAALRYAIHFAQFAPSFIDLSAAQQTALFASILQLDLWEKAAARASEYAVQVEQAEAEIKLEASGLLGQIKELDEASYEADERAWAATQKANIAVAIKKQKAAQKELDALPIANPNRTEKTAQALAKCINTHAGLNRDCEAVKRKIKELERSNFDTCPTCGAKCDTKHVRKELAKHKQELDTLTLATTAAFNAVARAQKAAQDEARALGAENRARADAENNVRQAELEHQRLVKQPNPYTAKRIAAEKRRTGINKRLDALSTDLRDIELELAGAKVWVHGFKEIRLQQIQQSLAQFEVEANEALFQLGLQDWAIEFAVERENKTGGISKAFTTMVKAPHVSSPVPWEVWSGGEAQRLRLAIAMGLANLICGRLGVQPNIELWDEPSSWLNHAGIQDLLGVLADRAERLGKVLLLADHRALEFGRFAGTIQIVKDENGSQVTLTPSL